VSEAVAHLADFALALIGPCAGYAKISPTLVKKAYANYCFNNGKGLLVGSMLCHPAIQTALQCQSTAERTKYAQDRPRSVKTKRPKSRASRMARAR